MKNHTIPPENIDGALDAAKRFFSLPEFTKMSIDIRKSPNFKGYTALLGENLNPANRGDLHEGFDIGWEEIQSGKSERADDGAMAGVNVWPDVLPGFREACLDY